MSDLTGIGAVADLAGTVISKIWPDKSEQERQQLAAAVSLVQGQLAINQAEASNPNTFVSGWRPAIGWVCGLACAWNWVGVSVVNALAELAGHTLSLAPANTTEMMPVLLGLLGLGGLRTFEKVQGVARK
jgi:hypothetical protein